MATSKRKRKNNLLNYW